MQKAYLQLAAALIAACGVASCDRRSNGASLALNDAPARSSPYPSAIPPPAEAPAPPPSPRVDPLSREALSDTAITSRTQSAIATDPAMAGADVSVNTEGGVVSLTGTVKSREQAAIASGIAQRNDGVIRVDSHLSTPPE